VTSCKGDSLRSKSRGRGDAGKKKDNGRQRYVLSRVRKLKRTGRAGDDQALTRSGGSATSGAKAEWTGASE